MSAEGSTSHILQSLAVNVAIAIGKGIAAVVTGSGSLLAETLHSFADCGNQILLLVGVRRARKKPDASHPFGYAREMYFWSFIVSLLLFTGGGMFSLYEGVHKLRAPEPVERVWVGLGILAFSFLLEGASTLSNIKEINARRGSKGFFQYLRDTKDSDLVVVFGENSAAVVGLVFAMSSLAMASLTGDGRWDAVGSLLIGAVLVAVAVFLGTEIKSLLVGEAADTEIEAVVRGVVSETKGFGRVLDLRTVQQGPGEVLIAVKVSLTTGVTADDICRQINEFEAVLRARVPGARWVFVEPDFDNALPAPLAASVAG